MLYSPQDVIINRFLLESKEPAAGASSEDLAAMGERDNRRLQVMVNYCMTRNCLREYILRYFGEYGSGACGNCEALATMSRGASESRGSYLCMNSSPRLLRSTAP